MWLFWFLPDTDVDQQSISAINETLMKQCLYLQRKTKARGKFVFVSGRHCLFNRLQYREVIWILSVFESADARQQRDPTCLAVAQLRYHTMLHSVELCCTARPL